MIETFLSDIGTGVASSAVYEVLKNWVAGKLTDVQARQQIDNVLQLNGVNMSASSVISALVNNGHLSINNSSLYAVSSIEFGSVKGSAVMGNGSSLKTSTSEVLTGQGAAIVANGNSGMKLNPDGSITFHVG